MPRIRVRQGDTISSIAERYSLLPETVWNDPANSGLKALRKNPDILSPGDVVEVRRKELKELSIATGQRHRFRRKGYPSTFTLQLLEAGEPRANVDYVLEIDGQLFSGVTDAEGMIRHPKAPDSKRGRLTIGEDEEYEFRFGYVEPLTEETGVRDLLRNLGYLPSEDADADTLRAAILAFQEAQGLEQTGKIDLETRERLGEIYRI